MGIEHWFRKVKSADQIAEELAAGSKGGADAAAMSRLADELIQAVERERGGK